ncbi:MAG: TIGR03618 family F420-dependent PPOX class oxidoreductase [Chloroflexota bacterium]|nr:TIGR03618 family F420-dependent PPOX class oxidoreductase [Chloroflexota bacterium]
MGGFIPWHKVDLPLRAARSIWISTTRPDGRPHAMPVWFWWDGRDIWVATQRGSQKGRNLARQPWAVVHVGDGDDVIILEGLAQEVTEPSELERVKQAWQEKYVDPYTGARASVPEEGDVVYRIRVKRVMTWEYGVVGTRTDWRMENGVSQARRSATIHGA